MSKPLQPLEPETPIDEMASKSVIPRDVDILDDLRHALRLLARYQDPALATYRQYEDVLKDTFCLMTPRDFTQDEFKLLSITTKERLVATNAALQMVLQKVEHTLTCFELPGMFLLQGADSSTCDGKITQPPNGFEPFRRWLIHHYTHRFSIWPPEEDASTGRRLNKAKIVLLQKDFEALYEYLVDRDMEWGMFHSCEKDHEILVNSVKDESLGDDNYSFISKGMIVKFDNLHGLLHIPHPMPLLTRASTRNVENWTSSGGLPAVVSSPTNLEKLDMTLQKNQLVVAFQNYEAALACDGVGRDEARIGQWVLLYGIMQSLSLVTSDLPALNHDARIQNAAPSMALSFSSLDAQSDVKQVLEAAQKTSYCWKAPNRWGDPSSQRTLVDNYTVPPAIVVTTDYPSWDHGEKEDSEETMESSTGSVCEYRAEQVHYLQGLRPTIVDLTAESFARKQAERRRRWSVESVPLLSRNDSD